MTSLIFCSLYCIFIYLFIYTQRTFHYDSSLWSNKENFNLTGGKTGFDVHETKLPTYWNTSFSKLCLSMKIDEQHNFVVIDKYADSLYSLIADGHYRATSLGRDTWKTLIGSEASLQPNCNKEGFNVVAGSSSHSKARVGIIANENNDCSSCDSRIGFGTGGFPDYTQPRSQGTRLGYTNTCGNAACCSGDNGDRYIRAMGYILVQ